LVRTDYQRFFSCLPEVHFARELEALVDLGCASRDGDNYVLTDLGRTYTDVIGRLFFSAQVRARMQQYWPRGESRSCPST